MKVFAHYFHVLVFIIRVHMNELLSRPAVGLKHDVEMLQ